MGDTESRDDRGSLPARESWHHIQRRPMLYSFAFFSGVGLVLAVSWIFARGRDSPSYVLLSFLYVSQFLMFGAVAWVAYKTRIEADLNGLHIVTVARRKTFKWADIAEIRPRNTKRFKRWLVLVMHEGEVIDFPLAVEHLAAVRRWQAAAAGTQHSP